MKYLLTAFVLIATLQTSHAQADLSFNRVVLVEFDVSVSSQYNFTVPAGKVWKVVEAGTGTTSSSSAIYLRNSSGDFIGMIEYNGSNADYIDLPLWLPAGYTGTFEVTSSSDGFVSILEFNTSN